MSGPTVPEPPSAFDARGRERRRLMGDAVARHVVRAGGIGVILAVVLIGFYLLYVVLPLFQPARLLSGASYPAPGGPGPTWALALDEQVQLGVRLTGEGRATFFRLADGAVVQEWRPPLPEGIRVVGLALADPVDGTLGLGLSQGGVLVARLHFEDEYGPGGRRVVPRVSLPLGPQPLAVAPPGTPVKTFALRVADDTATVAAVLEDPRPREVAWTGGGGAQAPGGQGWAAGLEVVELAAGGLLADDAPWAPVARRRLELAAPASGLVLSGDGRWLYACASGGLWAYDLTEPGETLPPQALRGARPLAGQLEGITRSWDAAAEASVKVTALRMLLGGTSLLVGYADGGLEQWFPVRAGDGHSRLERVRSFEPLPGAVRDLATEHRRRGFLAVAADGTVGVYHTTAGRRLLGEPLQAGALTRVAVSPRGDALLAEDGAGHLHFRPLSNPHPEVSWSALWQRVWYEGHEAPQFKWQSSAATSDVEPKLSLVPLTFGTLKAAFYAMLLAVPLAIAGAVYTAHFMDRRLRGWVKPTIEVMEALPTVILGFLAGLWLSPFVEANLPGVLAVMLIVPAGVLGFAGAWHALPTRPRERLGPGWEAALLVPVIAACFWVGIELGRPLERALFGGDLRGWLTQEVGIDFDQRNAIVVGIAMGFAVIPNIFSIAEDAVFGVPRHLVHGSLALGATPWQTVARVVLPTASPGIFSAVMIGFGRAVGETMIVLMATGNTPVLDFSPFLGMRTLSANVAVEMPESEVGSTHFRVLFLAALVLFLFTFVLNTAAEVVRHRLRRRYSAL